MKVLNASVGFLLTRTARSMKRVLEARLSEHHVTATQYVVLSILAEEEGISLSKLGNRLYFDNPTITGVVDRMERDGLLERRRILDDRRVINVFLTGKGKKLIRTVEKIATEVNDEAMRDFTKPEREKFLKTLDSIWKKMRGKNSH